MSTSFATGKWDPNMLASLLLAASLHAGTAPVLRVETVADQGAAGPSPEALGQAVEIGGLAALAPLCGLRDEAWSADLRRSTIQAATGATKHDDAALKAAPGSERVIGALSYAETEALEDFAGRPQAATCGKLASDPILPRADAMVRHFREGAPAS